MKGGRREERDRRREKREREGKGREGEGREGNRKGEEREGRRSVTLLLNMVALIWALVISQQIIEMYSWPVSTLHSFISLTLCRKSK